MGKIIARYDYTNSRGTPTFRKIRREGKQFTVRSAAWQDTKGTWHYRNGVPDEMFNLWIRALYKLPDVVTALRAHETVYWCEGEKDAETLTALGLTATTTPNPSELWDAQARWFTRGRTQSPVVVVCDQDEHGGWWGWERYTALIRVGVDPRRITVTAPRSLRHNDVTDLVEATGSLDAMRIVRLGRLEACAGRYTARRAARYAVHARAAKGVT